MHLFSDISRFFANFSFCLLGRKIVWLHWLHWQNSYFGLKMGQEQLNFLHWLLKNYLFFLMFRNLGKMQNKYYRSYLPKISKILGNKYDHTLIHSQFGICMSSSVKLEVLASCCTCIFHALILYLKLIIVNKRLFLYFPVVSDTQHSEGKVIYYNQ